jgi:hypothetical protein
MLEGVPSRDNADQVVRIVRLLADSHVQNLPPEAAWQRNWWLTLARELAELLLGEETPASDSRDSGPWANEPWSKV